MCIEMMTKPSSPVFTIILVTKNNFDLRLKS